MNPVFEESKVLLAFELTGKVFVFVSFMKLYWSCGLSPGLSLYIWVCSRTFEITLVLLSYWY